MSRQRGNYYGITPTPIRIPEDLKSWINQRAEENGTTMQGQIHAMLLIAKQRLISEGGENAK